MLAAALSGVTGSPSGVSSPSNADVEVHEILGLVSLCISPAPLTMLLCSVSAHLLPDSDLALAVASLVLLSKSVSIAFPSSVVTILGRATHCAITYLIRLSLSPYLVISFGVFDKSVSCSALSVTSSCL